MGLLLKCEHVGFGYENQDAVLDVNLEVNEGRLHLHCRGKWFGKKYPDEGHSGTFKTDFGQD